MRCSRPLPVQQPKCGEDKDEDKHDDDDDDDDDNKDDGDNDDELVYNSHETDYKQTDTQP